MDKLHYKSAVDIAELIRSKKVSAVEVLEHFLKRIETYNSKLNAIIWMDAERSRKRAREADAALARGETWGPLHGVPMTIKESFEVPGSPTTWGLPEMKDNVTETSALAVQRLEKAGVNLFGKTNVPLMLADWQSYNEIYGTTNNPWNTALTPGGSSGGASAALAAGLTGVEAGSDIGSSIRNPAHYCGLFGLKPTYGIIPQRGHRLPDGYAPADINVAGPLARSAADLDIMLDVMSGADEIDENCWKLDLPKSAATSLKGLRVAVKLRDPLCEIDGAYGDVLQAFVDKLAKAGAIVKEGEPDIDTRRLFEVYVLLLRATTSGRTTDAEIEGLKASLAALGANPDPYLQLMIRGVTLSHRAWLPLNNERYKLRYAFDAFFKDWDVLICPVAASAAWPHNQEGERWRRTIPINGKPQPTTSQLFWAGYSGVVFLPSTVGPAGFTKEGLPVGYQAIARHGYDKTAIAFSRHVEREIGGFVPPPGYD
jgi:amidase